MQPTPCTIGQVHLLVIVYRAVGRLVVNSRVLCFSSTAHVSDVEAIAARAERDVKVESAIKNFEEVWLSKLFDLTEYQRSYPTTRAEVCVYIVMNSPVKCTVCES